MRAGGETLRRELRRKAVHVGCGLLAPLLAWLSWPQALLLALSALAFNLLVLPRVGGRSLLRDDERARGWSTGIVLYPACVALVILVFRERLGIAAGAWALLAFGDGLASVAGRLGGRHALPWNAAKSVEGLAAHALAGGAACGALLWWVGDPALGGSVALAFAVGGAAALVTALLETADVGVDDNVTVTLGGAALLWLGLAVASSAELRDEGATLATAALALALCAGLAAAAWWRRALTVSGALASVVVGALVAGGAGWGAFLVLLAFFVLGTGATRLGRAVKEARGIAEARGGRRAAGNVISNGGVAALAAPLVLPGPAPDVVATAGVALASALATAAFDTVSSEIGKAWGRRTYLATTFRPVPPGTEGAVSLEGTLAGAAAAAALGCVAALGGVLPAGQASAGVVAVVAGAFAGTTFESLAGALLESSGRRVDNHALNFANTLVGALAGAGAFAVLTSLAR